MKIPRHISRQGIFDWLRFDDFCEDRWMFRSELGENFAIEDDSAFLEISHELRVGGAKQTSSGVDADLHEATVIALLEATVAVGVGAGFGGGNFGESDAVLATPHHSFGAGQDILSTFDAMGSTFDARHMTGSSE